MRLSFSRVWEPFLAKIVTVGHKKVQKAQKSSNSSAPLEASLWLRCATIRGFEFVNAQGSPNWFKTRENASFRGQRSRILPWKDPGLENLAAKGARVPRFCFERGQGSRIWFQKLLGLEDLALKGDRVRGIGDE